MNPAAQYVDVLLNLQWQPQKKPRNYPKTRKSATGRTDIWSEGEKKLLRILCLANLSLREKAWYMPNRSRTAISVMQSHLGYCNQSDKAKCRTDLKPWNPWDYDKLRQLYAKGLTNQQIGLQMGRTGAAIKNQIQKKGLKGREPVKGKAFLFGRHG